MAGIVVCCITFLAGRRPFSCRPTICNLGPAYILNNDLTLKNWFIILFLPFYSSMVLSNFFFACGLFVFITGYSLVKRKLNYHGLLAWLLFVVFMLIPEYRLLYMQFIKHLTSARGNYFSFLLNMKGVFGLSLKLMIKGQYHFYSMQWPVIIFTVLLSLFVMKGTGNSLLLLVLLLAVFICAFADTIHKSKDLVPLLNTMGELKYVQFRFICMLPILWHVLFALAIYTILTRSPALNILALIVIIINTGLIFFNVFPRDSSESIFTENSFYYTYIDRNDDEHSTFHSYYSPGLFTEVKNKINYNHEYALCFGFEPEIAQYNNIYTISSSSSYLPNNTIGIKNVFLPTVTGNDRSIHYHYDSLSLNKIITSEKDTVFWHKHPIGYIFSIFRLDNYKNAGLDSIAYTASPDKGLIGGLFIYKFHIH